MKIQVGWIWGSHVSGKIATKPSSTGHSVQTGPRETYYTLRDNANDEIASIDQMVDVIVDMQDSDIVSNAINYDEAVYRPSNIGITVIVSRRLLFHPYSKIFRYIFSGGDESNIYTVSTLEEAYALLNAKQPA